MIHLQWACIPLLTMLNQMFIKWLANGQAGEAFSLNWMASALHSPLAMGILLCEIASFVLWMRILAVTPVSRAVPLTAVSYLLILIVSWTIFKEPVHLLQVAGSILILWGVSVISTASRL